MVGWKASFRMARQLHLKSRFRPPRSKARPGARESTQQPIDKARSRFRVDIRPLYKKDFVVGVAAVAVVLGVPTALSFAMYSPIYKLRRSSADIQSLAG
jgi:hypothetical protein